MFWEWQCFNKTKIMFLYTVAILLGLSEAALEFSKCSIKDSECQLNFFQNVGETKSPVGIPEIGVPPLDPFHLENVTVPVMDFFNLTLISGECLGIRTCTVSKYETDLVNFRKIAEITCKRIVIQGTYNITPNPLQSALFGDPHGSGNGSIVLEDWYYKFNYEFEFIKKEDGKIYIKIKPEGAQWTSKVLKNVTVTADNIISNDQDVTKDTLSYINRDWEFLLDIFGYYFHKISIDYYFEMYGKFFSSIPTSLYLNDDLEPYVKKNPNGSE